MKDEFLSEDEMLAHIGSLLLNVQQFELLLKGALKQIYADAADLTAEKLFAEDKRTLGMMLGDLRKIAAVESDADALFVAVLRDRNLFVHSLRHQKWFDTSTESSRRRVWEFLGPFTQNLLRAIRLFIAIHVKHGDEIGFDSPAMRELKTDALWKVSDYYPYAAKIQKKS